MKLELKHLAPYLPYGLKITFEGDEHKHELVGLVDSVHGIKIISPFGDCGSATFDESKPILRPLSDLTKEIEHNRKRFVPTKMFARSKEKDIKEYRRMNEMELLEHYIIERLFEWHFDIYGLIDKNLAIDLNTIEQ